MLPQTRQYRLRNAQLRAVLLRDLLTIWPALSGARLDATYPNWLVMAAAITGRDRGNAVLLAADYLAAFPLSIPVVGPPVVPVQQFNTSMRVTSVVAVKKSMLAGKTVEQAMRDAFVVNSGTVARYVLDAGRQTVMHTSVADPVARGWRRVARSTACPFCVLLSSRGGVYSEATVDFPSHGHCSCSAEPVYA